MCLLDKDNEPAGPSYLLLVFCFYCNLNTYLFNILSQYRIVNVFLIHHKCDLDETGVCFQVRFFYSTGIGDRKAIEYSLLLYFVFYSFLLSLNSWLQDHPSLCLDLENKANISFSSLHYQLWCLGRVESIFYFLWLHFKHSPVHNHGYYRINKSLYIYI